MKKKMAVFTVFAIPLLAGTFMFSSDMSAKMDAKKEAKEVVVDYLKSFQAKDFEKAAKKLHDKRFVNEEEAIQDLSERAENDTLKNFKVLSVEAIDANNVEVKVEVDSTLVGLKEVTLPLVKENDQWSLSWSDVPTFEADNN